MAASTESSIRVKLLFKHIDINPSWFCVYVKESLKVSDVEKRIISKFGLCEKHVELFVSGCRLPSWETTCVLRENDIVHVFLQKANELDVNTHSNCQQLLDGNTKKKKKKKEKKKREQQCDESHAPSDNDICSIADDDIDVDTNTMPCLQKRKQEILEVLDDAIAYANECDRVNEGKEESHLVLTYKKAHITDTIDGEEKMELADLTSTEEPTRKRKRKRKRKNKANEFHVDQSIENGTVSLEASTANPLPFNEEINMTLPHYKQPNNKHITFSEDNLPSDTPQDCLASMQDHDNLNFPQPQFALTHNQPVPVCYHTEETMYPTENHHLEEGTRIYKNKLYPKVKETTLSNGVTVFTRQKKIPVPHLNKQVPLKSVTLENDASRKLESPKHWKTIGITASKVTDYSQYPDLEAPPHRSDNIAFKMVELKKNCPEISSYKRERVVWRSCLKKLFQLADPITQLLCDHGRVDVTDHHITAVTSREQSPEAEVISYDPITTKVQLQLSSENQHTCMGKFHTNLDASKSEETNADCIVTLDWVSLVEPKLLC